MSKSISRWRLPLHLASFCAVYLHNVKRGLIESFVVAITTFDFDPRSVEIKHFTLFRYAFDLHLIRNCSRGIYAARFVYFTFALAVAEISLLTRSTSTAATCQRLFGALLPVLCLLAAPNSTVLLVFMLQALRALRSMAEEKEECVWVWVHLILGSTGYFLMVRDPSRFILVTDP